MTAVLLTAGCEHADPLEVDTNDATLTNVQASIFTPSCALSGCHLGSSAQQGLDLSAGQAFDNLVGVASRERPNLMRVDPGDPEASYIVHKIEGRADIAGQRMPLNMAMLSPDQIQLIRDWIADGAQDN